MTVYVGYARGLEESGIAPPNAANRNQPLAAVITSQKMPASGFHSAS